ncbi:hypothetical protein Trydic_g12306, partial [Trypoxylus dichotomus]
MRVTSYLTSFRKDTSTGPGELTPSTTDCPLSCPETTPFECSTEPQDCSS